MASSLLCRLPVKTLRGILVATAVLSASSGTSQADLIVLKNGSEIRGRVISQDDRDLLLEVAYGKMTVPKANVREIREENADEYLRKTGERLLIARDYDKALDFLRQARLQNPDSPSCKAALLDGLARAAESARSRRRHQEVESLLAEARGIDPEHPGLHATEKALAAIKAERVKVELEARQAIETQDIEGAYTALRWLCDNFPEERSSWQKPLARLALARAHLDFEESRTSAARTSYQEALSLDPDLIPYAQEPLAFLEIKEVVPLLERGEFESARSRLRATYDLLPGNAAVLYHFALATEGCGDLSGAADMYASLAGASQIKIDGVRHLSELRARAEFQMNASPAVGANRVRDRRSPTAEAGKIETSHFIIHHHDEGVAEEAGRYLEHHYDRIGSSWFANGSVPALRHKIEVRLHAEREAYLAASSSPAWSDGWSQTRRRYGLLVGQEIHLDTTAPQFLSTTIPHELGHVLLPHWFGAGVEAPLWVEEGVATSEEPAFKQRYFDRIVREATDDGALLPLANLTALRNYPDAPLVPLLYAQSNSIVRFLRERLGTREALALLRNTCVAPDDGLKGSGFATLQDLEREWLRWLERRQTQK